MKDLAKEYAALVPEWARPGMRCVDPVTGNGYRHIGEGDFFDEQNTCNVGWRGDGDEPDCDRAIAAGPDLDDAATVGAMLMGLPDAQLASINNQWLGPIWGVRPTRDEPEHIAATRAEAIIRACIAQAKGN